ncbi:MAG: flippase-like domain-containing protein [Sphingobacteriales bacterium]|nr:MAG: flippase-like domain-containing protein [Sphingobacteriales bacterium]
MKKRTLITAVQYLIFLGLGIFIIYRMFHNMSSDEKTQMLASVKQTRLLLFIPVIIGGFFSHFFRALRWRLLLKPLNIYPGVINTTLSVLIGYIVNLLVPRMGEIAKCTVLARYEKVPADKMVGTIVAERAFDVLTLGVITVAAFVLQSDVIGIWVDSNIGAFAAKRSVFIMAILGLIAFVLLLIFLYRRNKESKVAKFLKGMADGISSIIKMKDRGMFLLYTVLIWGLYWFMVMIGFWSLPATDHLGGLTALVVLVFGSVGMIVTPGGLGAYPVLVAQILLCYAISISDGNALGWVSWLGQTAVIIILGLISLVVLPIYNRNKQRHAQAPVDTK